MKRNRPSTLFIFIVFMLAVWLCWSFFLVATLEGADPVPTPICEQPPCYVLIPPTPTAPLPTCQIDSTVPCFTPTRDGHWINPIPWPTYDYPDPYPAPTDEPPPAPYPEAKEDKPHYVAETGSEWDLWAWIWDLGSSLFK